LSIFFFFFFFAMIHIPLLLMILRQG